MTNFDCISGTESYIKNQQKTLESQGFTTQIQRISKDWYSLKFWS